MSKRSWAAVTALTFAAAALAWAFAGPTAAKSPASGQGKPAEARKGAARNFFGLDKVHAFHLEISAKEWDKMQPVGGIGFPGRPGGFGGPGQQPAPKQGEERRDVHRGGGFGVEFPWARGALTADGKTLKDVGVRFKGNASYMASARGLKR
ncbi:MAG TPA: hypothetical protein VFA26_13385, partial [Gemmataceae bacterium]|nr:hypothetical protein [Gemmataceae bacterium]